jgi:hypothetical protein
MRCFSLAAGIFTPLLLLSLTHPGSAQAPELSRISGPVVYENLAVYFIHGTSAPGKVPLTLEEAIARGTVKVIETSNVNQLEIENLGVPIAAFCVEEGRWTARGREDARSFSAASASVPSRELKLAMKAPVAAAPPAESGVAPSRQRAPNGGAADTGARQQQVWESIRATQSKLTGSLGASVRSTQSISSLQLSLESEELKDAQRGYVEALKAAGEQENDIVGFAFAVNGAINSADVYPSNGLFRKMWAKLLTAGVIEAIGHRNEPAVPTPAAEAVHAFLAAAESGKSSETTLNASARLETREAAKAYLFEAARVASPSAPPSWVHRNYLAK